jgi:hypothetical protein
LSHTSRGRRHQDYHFLGYSRRVQIQTLLFLRCYLGPGTSATHCTVSSLPLLFIVLSNNKKAAATDSVAGKPRFQVRNNNTILRTSGREKGEGSESQTEERLPTRISRAWMTRTTAGGHLEICASRSIYHVLSDATGPLPVGPSAVFCPNCGTRVSSEI